MYSADEIREALQIVHTALVNAFGDGANCPDLVVESNRFLLITDVGEEIPFESDAGKLADTLGSGLDGSVPNVAV